MRKIIFTCCLILIGLAPHNARAIDYSVCQSADQSATCSLAFTKIRTLTNPLTKKKYFDNGFHFIEGKLFMFPNIDVAETDLDGDGFKEIIAKIDESHEEIEGYFCLKNKQCPHFILQDRNVDQNNLRLSRIKAMGPIYVQAIGLSTDEVVNNFKSLRGYTNLSARKFDVYQYDRKKDQYFNISQK